MTALLILIFCALAFIGLVVQGVREGCRRSTKTAVPLVCTNPYVRKTPPNLPAVASGLPQEPDGQHTRTSGT